MIEEQMPNQIQGENSASQKPEVTNKTLNSHLGSPVYLLIYKPQV